MNKKLRLVLFLFCCLFAVVVNGQISEVAIPVDTLVVRFFKKDGRINREDIYQKGTRVAVKNWYYTKEFYGFRMEILSEKLMKRVWIQEFYSNGSIRIDGSTIKGKKSGSYKTYFQNGSPQCNCNYKEGRQDSTQHIYFENGQLWTERTYMASKPWEVKSNFNKNGDQMAKGTLKDGNGTLYCYSEEGVLTDIEHYTKGKLVKTEHQSTQGKVKVSTSKYISE